MLTATAPGSPERRMELVSPTTAVAPATMGMKTRQPPKALDVKVKWKTSLSGLAVTPAVPMTRSTYQGRRDATSTTRLATQLNRPRGSKRERTAWRVLRDISPRLAETVWAWSQEVKGCHTSAGATGAAQLVAGTAHEGGTWAAAGAGVHGLAEGTGGGRTSGGAVGGGMAGRSGTRPVGPTGGAAVGGTTVRKGGTSGIGSSVAGASESGAAGADPDADTVHTDCWT